MFWNIDGSSTTTICIGDGQMIYAPGPGENVKKKMYKGNTYWGQRFVTARRYWS